MDDPLLEAKRRAAELDLSRTVEPRHQPFMSFAAPVFVGLPAFFVFFVGLRIVGAPIEHVSLLGWLVAVVVYSCVAIISAQWPDRTVLTVLSSATWVLVATPFLFFFASLATDGHSGATIFSPSIVVPILVLIPIMGYTGMWLGEYFRTRH